MPDNTCHLPGGAAITQRVTADIVAMQKLGGISGWHYRLKPWERVVKVTYSDSLIGVTIDTYEVKEMAREDRYLRHGTRRVMLELRPSGRWEVEFDDISWDDDFVPFVFEKVGRRKTAEEFTEQRDWEKMCYRPGPGLDSYTRVMDGIYSDSEKRMERHF